MTYTQSQQSVSTAESKSHSWQTPVTLRSYTNNTPPVEMVHNEVMLHASNFAS